MKPPGLLVYSFQYILLMDPHISHFALLGIVFLSGYLDVFL
jgi:hypothetical protein